MAYTLAGVVSGAIFFREFWEMSRIGVGMYALGLAGVAAGIVLSLAPADVADGVQQLQKPDGTSSLTAGADDCSCTSKHAAAFA